MAWEATYLLSPVLLLLLDSGSCAPSPETLRTLEGETVPLKCMYHPRYSSNEKIWCKRISEDICKPPVRNDSTGAEKLRFFIDKYTGSNYFLVILRDLKMSDSGIYYCMIIGNSSNSIILRTIHLVVSADSSKMTTQRNFPTTGLSDLPIRTTTEYSLSHTAMTRSLAKPTAVISSPGPGVAIINGTDAARSSISSVIVPLVCGLLSKTLVYTVLFVFTQRSFG